LRIDGRTATITTTASSLVDYRRQGTWRRQLIDNLEQLTRQLWQVEIREVYADRSFAEDKDHSNDVDGYFVCELELRAPGRLDRELNLIDPDKVWTWSPASRRPYRGYPRLQLPMSRRWGAVVVSETDTEMSWGFLRHSAVRDGTVRREGSSRRPAKWPRCEVVTALDRLARRCRDRRARR
jgi:hypothetical protein